MSPNLFQIGAASMDNPMAALTMAQKVFLEYFKFGRSA